MNPILLTLPIRVVSVANLREHHRPKARRTADHRGTVKLALWARCAELRAFYKAHTKPKECLVRVVLSRQGVRRLDGDNLQSACKGVRDGVADALGIDDADPRVTWQYEQHTPEKNAPLGGLQIRIERLDKLVSSGQCGG